MASPCLAATSRDNDVCICSYFQPQVLINLNHINPPSAMHSEGFDLSLLGTCDDVVTYISDMTHLGEGVCKFHISNPAGLFLIITFVFS